MKWTLSPYNDCKHQLWLDWGELKLRINEDNPFLARQLLEPLIDIFNSENETIFVLELCDGSSVQAIFLVKKDCFYKWSLFIPSQLQIAPVLINPAVKINLSELFSVSNGLVQYALYNIDPLFQAGLLNTLCDQVDRTEIATNMRIRVSGDFQQYWQSRNKKLQKNHTRYEARLAKEIGVPEFVCISDAEGIALAVDQYGILESKGWKGSLGTALHPTNSQGQFYKNVLDNFAQHNQARVFQLRLQEKVVATRLCIFSGDILIALKTTYDETYKKHAVGRILLYKMIEHIFETRLTKVIDFYTNATKEQLEWATETRPIYLLEIYRTSIVRKIFSVLRRLKTMVMSVKK